MCATSGIHLYLGPLTFLPLIRTIPMHPIPGFDNGHFCRTICLCDQLTDCSSGYIPAEDPRADHLIFINIQLCSTYFLKVWTEMISSEGWSLCSPLLKPKDSTCFYRFTLSPNFLEGSTHQNKRFCAKQVHIEMVSFLHHCSMLMPL